MDVDSGASKDFEINKKDASESRAASLKKFDICIHLDLWSSHSAPQKSPGTPASLRQFHFNGSLRIYRKCVKIEHICPVLE